MPYWKWSQHRCFVLIRLLWTGLALTIDRLVGVAKIFFVAVSTYYATPRYHLNRHRKPAWWFFIKFLLRDTKVESFEFIEMLPAFNINPQSWIPVASSYVSAWRDYFTCISLSFWSVLLVTRQYLTRQVHVVAVNLTKMAITCSFRLHWIHFHIWICEVFFWFLCVIFSKSNFELSTIIYNVLSRFPLKKKKTWQKCVCLKEVNAKFAIAKK